jgi:hypothetical protein
VTAVPDVPPSAAAVVAVAFCPAPPLLLPAVAGRAAEDTAELRAACLAAVRAVLATGPEVVVVVGAAPSGARYGPGDAGSLRGFGVDLRLPFAGPARAGAAAVARPHSLGAWLLDEAGAAPGRVGVAPDGLAGALAEASGPVAVLAMGDGSARRTIRSPGWWDTAGEPFDDGVAAALAAGDAARLAVLDAVEGERLLAEGVPTWRAVGAALAGRPVTARLRCHVAPYGVGYLVADWLVR